MDLVDINKVLDSLELKDENRHEVANTKQSETNSKFLYSEGKNEPVSGDDLTNVGATNFNSTSDRITTHFTGVSKVLNSLDDYCNHVANLSASVDFVQANRSTDESDDNRVKFKSTDKFDDDEINLGNVGNAIGDQEQELSSTSITMSSSFSSDPSLALLSIESALSIENPSEEQVLNTILNRGNELEGSASRSLCVPNAEKDQLARDINTEYSNDFSPKFFASENNTFPDTPDQLKSDLGQENLNFVNSDYDYNNISLAQPPHQTLTAAFGSTMDEISDTELDSILQEIEPEEAHFESIYKGSVRSNSSFNKGQLTSSQIKNKPEDVTSAYSKASSVGDVSVITNVDHPDSYAVFLHSIEHGNTEFIEEEGTNDVHKNVRHTSLKRQRPTTLDLPARKLNLYATAGQTPPGSRTYDQTTSSSEENTPDVQAETFTNEAGHATPEGELPSVASGSNKCGTKSPVSPAAYEDTQVEKAKVLDVYSNVNLSIGKTPPVWVPDNETSSCMQCEQKFSILKRRHHCRACGQVLCSICCSQKFKLEFLSNPESRVCIKCFLILTGLQQQVGQPVNDIATSSTCPARMPNPNNPMEYCSTIPPHYQVNTEIVSCPTVIVPVGVLKKENNQKFSYKRKSVMFSDGIRPGSDLANLDGRWCEAEYSQKPESLANTKKESRDGTTKNEKILKGHAKKVLVDRSSDLIPAGEHNLPPISVSYKSGDVLQDVPNNADLIKQLHSESLKFAIQKNFHVFVKITHLKCCINKTVINFTTCGLHHVGNDEIIILLELNNSNVLPKDIFVHLNQIYYEASKGRPITELGFSMPNEPLFLGSRQHGGFLFIRSTFQCLQDVHVPNSPFLIGLLIHRWEVPWAKIFPLRLMLRLGAQYRYYPSPHISVRDREPVYAEIAQTIINLLADFRNYTYTLPTIKGMFIHMQDRRTNILIPRNRHEEVMSAIKNASDHILAMGANFSKKADGHLVCIQNINSDSTDSNSYSTQAINIQGQPRKVTGASFFILNEALKSNSGLSGKCSIIEDGLMVQILPAKMAEVKDALINMRDIDIVCGPIETRTQQTEMVCMQWMEEDAEINIGVRSPIDSKQMNGIPSIRVHSGVNLTNNNHILKWTEVFILESNGICTPAKYSTVDISNISEVIAKSTTIALLPFLDLLAANGYNKIGLRVTLNQDRVCYEAGSESEKLPPLYMNALDLELIPVLHKQAAAISRMFVLELIFYILNA